MSKPYTDFDHSNVEKKVLRAVDQTLHNYHMLQTGDAVLVAVSGGPDSVALAHILLALAPRYSLKIALAHLNHCLRKTESDRDEAFVVSLAKQLSVPVYVAKEDVRGYQKRHHLSLEDAARQVRYRFYHSIAAEHAYDKIALGHHGDDNAELVLMYLLRGSGPRGLCGIPPVRDDIIVRPMINLRRSEIIDYLTAKKLAYLTDSSNRDVRYLRNKIRDRLIPELKKEYNPKLVDSLNRLTAILGPEEKWIEDLVDRLFEKAMVFEGKNTLGLSIQYLNQQPVAVRRRLIRKAILRVKANMRRIAFVHIEAAGQLARAGLAAGALDLPDRIRIRRDRDVLVVSEEATNLRRLAARSLLSKFPDYEYRLSAPGKIHIKAADVQMRFSEIHPSQLPMLDQAEQRTAFFDMDKVRFPLVIRNFRPGDCFSPLGVSGRQKLKKFFIDHKISRIERAKCPIVLSQQKIIWVAGHRLDNCVRIGPQTRRILKAELLVA